MYSIVCEITTKCIMKNVSFNVIEYLGYFPLIILNNYYLFF